MACQRTVVKGVSYFRPQPLQGVPRLRPPTKIVCLRIVLVVERRERNLLSWNRFLFLSPMILPTCKEFRTLCNGLTPFCASPSLIFLWVLNLSPLKRQIETLSRRHVLAQDLNTFVCRSEHSPRVADLATVRPRDPATPGTPSPQTRSGPVGLLRVVARNWWYLSSDRRGSVETR